MELYRVTVEYKNLHAHKEWNERCSDASRAGRKFTEPMPPPNTVERYAAVHGAFGADAISDAVKLALSSVIGPPDSWEKFEAIVTRVESVGPVAVQ